MGRNFLIYIFLFGAFASVMTSGVSTPTNGTFEERGEKPAFYSSDFSSEEDGGEPATAGTVELDRSPDGHFYADVEVNGQRIHFLVDTGASVIALSRDDARRAGLAPSISMPQVVGDGASGDVRGEIVTLDRVALGPNTATGLTAVVLDTGSQSLLGQSFLSKFASVEIRNDRMILR